MRKLDDYGLYFELVELFEEEQRFVIERFNFNQEVSKERILDIPQIIIRNVEDDTKYLYFDFIAQWFIKKQLGNYNMVSIDEDEAVLFKDLYRIIEERYIEISNKK
jgi:hypothetical protein